MTTSPFHRYEGGTSHRHAEHRPTCTLPGCLGIPCQAPPPRHTHVTRDIKPQGVCPACDDYWATHG